MGDKIKISIKAFTGELPAWERLLGTTSDADTIRALFTLADEAPTPGTPFCHSCSIDRALHDRVQAKAKAAGVRLITFLREIARCKPAPGEDEQIETLKQQAVRYRSNVRNMRSRTGKYNR